MSILKEKSPESFWATVRRLEGKGSHGSSLFSMTLFHAGQGEAR